MARMAGTDMVNGILLAGNLVFWGALFLCLGRKGGAARGGGMDPGTAGAAQAPGSCGGDWAQRADRNGGGPGFGGNAETARATVRATRPCFAQALAELLEFAVYGAGMIRLADLVLQGIAGPGGENMALLAVRVLLAESMLLLFPLWRMSYRWKLEENGISGRNHSHGMGALAGAAAGFPQGRMGTVPEEGEGILGMLLLLGLTLQGWQEQDAVRALGRQAWLLLLFFCYGYLRRRRRLRWYGNWNGMAGEAAQGCGCSVPGMPVAGYERSAAGIWTEGYGKSAMEPAPGPYGRKAPGMPPQGFARNTHQVRQMEYLRNVEEQYQRTRELWHDLKNHIKVLEILAQEERFGELTDYLDSFRRDVERRMVPARTGCAPVDALLGDKLYQAKRQDVEMSLQLCRLSQTGIEAVDLCVILGNLLDNALEACARLEGHGRIGLRMRQEESFYYITVVNTSGEPYREGGSYVSGKRGLDNRVGHGLGLRSVERLAHRYGGQLAADYSDGEFRVVVRLEDKRE